MARLRSIILAACLAVTLAPGVRAAAPAAAPPANDGPRWEYIRGTTLSYADFLLLARGADHPLYRWEKTQGRDETLFLDGAFPRAWMRVRIPALDGMARPVLYLPLVMLNVEAYLDGRRIYRFGDPDAPRSVFAGWPPHFIDLPADSAGKHLYLRVGSEYRPGLGLMREWRFGDRADIIARLIRKDVLRGGLGILFVAAGLLALALGLVKRAAAPTLLPYAGMALTMGLYTLSARTYQLQYLVWNAPLAWYYLEFLSLYAAPIAMAAFFRVLVPRSVTFRVIFWLQTAFLCYALVRGLVDLPLLYHMVENLLLIIGYSIATATVLVRETARGNADARAVIFAFLFFFAAAIIDSLLVMFFGSTFVFQTLSIGFLVFLAYLGRIALADARGLRGNAA